MSDLLSKLESMRVGGKARRYLAADVQGYAFFGRTRKEYRCVPRWNFTLDLGQSAQIYFVPTLVLCGCNWRE